MLDYYLSIEINITWRNMMAKDYVMIFVTAKDKVEAEKIGQLLVKERLIACANIVSPVSSVFHWSGKIEAVKEHLVLMKSRSDLFAQLSQRVKTLHSYDVPEVLALPLVDGSKAYLDWMGVVLKP